MMFETSTRVLFFVRDIRPTCGLSNKMTHVRPIQHETLQKILRTLMAWTQESTHIHRRLKKSLTCIEA